MDLETRYLSPQDVTPEQLWQLLEWCAAHGANEFTIGWMALGTDSAPALEAAEAVLEPFRSEPATRELMTVPWGQARDQVTGLWTLTRESIAVLRSLFPKGLLHDGASRRAPADGWLEDPTFYRGGETMLGVVSHEALGVLALNPDEHRQVAAMGIITHDSPPRH